MSCIYPYFTKYGHSVPCGKCPVCLQRRTEQWVFRLQQEQKNSLFSHFVTFTYDEDHKPLSRNGFPTLSTSHLTKFWKRLRKLVPYQLSYYAVGEYGSSGQRPHYHAIVFNCHNPDLFQLVWGDKRNGVFMGNVFIDEVNNNTCGYVAGYIQKKRIVPAFSTDDRRKEFSVMSKDLGQDILVKRWSTIIKKGTSILQMELNV